LAALFVAAFFAATLRAGASTPAVLRAAAFFAGVFFPAAVLADFAAALAAVLGAAFLVGISSVYQGVLATHGAIIQPAIIREGTDVCQRDPAVDMDQRALHQVLEIVEIHCARRVQGDEIPPDRKSVV
jgi:hypothetical protein